MDKVIIQRLLMMLALFFGSVTATTAANSFYMEPATVKQGETTVTLQFKLENETPFYGFQMDIQLPSGLEFEKIDNKPDITLSTRATDGDYRVVSHLSSDQKVTLGAFSGNHTPFTGSDGVLFTANVKVNTGFIGGNVEVTNVTFVNENDNDVQLEAYSAKVDVIVPVTGITLSKTEWSGEEGSTLKLTAAITPTNATNKSVNWTSSDASVATVAADGTVTAVKAGSTVITATAVDGSGVQAICNITVIVLDPDPTPDPDPEPNPDYQEIQNVRIGKLLYNLHCDGSASVTYEFYDTHENYIGLGYVELPETVEYEGMKYTVTEIGDHAFNRADITGIRIPSTVTRIGESSISDITNHFDKIEVPDNVTVIGVNAFIGTDMDEIVIGDGVTLIQQGAFAFTPALLKVTLGKGLETIDSEGFNSENIRTVVSNAVTPPQLQGYAPFSYNVYQTAVLYVPAESIELYRNDESWRQFKYILAIGEETAQPESITLNPTKYALSVGEEYRFSATVAPMNAIGYELIWTSSNENVAWVDNNGKVVACNEGDAVITVMVEGTDLKAQSIVTVTAQSYDNTESVKIGDLYYILNPEDGTAEVTYQYYRNDNNYSYLGSAVEIPENVVYNSVTYRVTYIGLAAFNRLKTLESVKLPASILGIRLDGFCETGLKKVEIGDACEFLDYGTFAWSYDLKEVVIGSSVNEIGGESFWQSDLEKVTCKAVTPPSMTSDWMPVFNDTSHENAILYVPAGSIELYRNDERWGLFKNIRAIDDEQDPDPVVPDDPDPVVPDDPDPVVPDDPDPVVPDDPDPVVPDDPDPTPVLPTGISITSSSLSMTVGEESTFVAIVNPAEAKDYVLVWTSSDIKVATVDSNGKVKAVGAGSVTITVSIEGTAISAKATISVEASQTSEPIEPDPVLATSLTLDHSVRDAVEGEEFVLVATVLPDNTTNPQLEWSSSDDSAATVDSEGRVKVLKAAPCVITVRTLDGSNLSATCKLNIVSGIEEILINGTDGKFDVYTLSGIMVIRQGTLDDFRNLAPGYYIVNRRKIYKSL